MTQNPSPVFTILSALICITLSACSSPETKREEAREKMGPPQPPLVGQSTYFDGKISATAYLNPAFRPHPSSSSDASGDTGKEGDHPRGRKGGGMGGEGMYGGEGHHRRGGGEGGEMTGGAGGGGPRPGAMAGGATPARQALTVTLTNTSSAPVNLQVTDVVSSLGNFVAVPEKATLAPGESMNLEPMRGALANLDEFNLNLGLRADGKSQQQTVTLKRASTE